MTINNKFPEAVYEDESPIRGPALIGAFRKGFLAGKNRQLKCSCPYNSMATNRGGATWERAFARAWKSGYQTGLDY